MIKKLSAVVLSVMLGISSISYPVYVKEAKESELLTKEQFATVDELKTFDTDDTNGKNPAKVYFGQNNQQWWIAGSQSDDSMTLFAGSPLATDQPFDSVGGHQ